MRRSEKEEVIDNASSQISDRFTKSQMGLLLILATVHFTHILDFVIIMPLGGQLRHQLHITPQQFSALVSSYGIAAMLSGLSTASIVDRFDRKHVLLVSFIGFVVATFYCGLAPSYWHLLVARSLTGLFGGVAGASVMAMVGDAFSDGQRGKAIGMVTSAFAVASVIGLPIGLWLAAQTGRWNTPFLAIGGFAVLVCLMAAIGLPSMNEHRFRSRESLGQQFVSLLSQRNHLIAFAMMLATVLGTFTIIPFIAGYLQANCGRQDSELPVLYAIAGVCTFISLNLVGWWTDRWGATRMFILCASGAVVMTLVFTHLPQVSLGAAIVTTCLFMVLASGRMVPAQTMMLRAADPKLRGAFMNINTAVTHLGTSLGPMITGAILGEEYEGGPLTHFGTAGFIAAGFGCLAIVISLFLKPHSKSRNQLAAPWSEPRQDDILMSES